MIVLASICCGVCSSWIPSGVQEANNPVAKIAATITIFRVFIIRKFL